MISRSDINLKAENSDLSDQIRRLQDEKADLLRNLENLTL